MTQVTDIEDRLCIHDIVQSKDCPKCAGNFTPKHPRHFNFKVDTAHLRNKPQALAMKIDGVDLEGCECGNLIGMYEEKNDLMVCTISMDLIKKLQGQTFEIVLVGKRVEREDGASTIPIFIRKVKVDDK